MTGLDFFFFFLYGQTIHLFFRIYIIKNCKLFEFFWKNIWFHLPLCFWVCPELKIILGPMLYFMPCVGTWCMCYFDQKGKEDPTFLWVAISMPPQKCCNVELLLIVIVYIRECTSLSPFGSFSILQFICLWSFLPDYCMALQWYTCWNINNILLFIADGKDTEKQSYCSSPGLT